ncbi:MAG: hypothetical protein E6F98_08250 [Actinobacteria bacterium]|nr:MAG: hypothetical protein E6F98_08250 [Actinomycetota bacterium]
MLRGAAGGLGLVCVLAGAVFFGQGIGAIGGSFMTGKREWAVIGALLVAAGLALLAAARFRDRRVP